MKKILLGTAFAVALTSFAGQASASLAFLDTIGQLGRSNTAVISSAGTVHLDSGEVVDSDALDLLLGGAVGSDTATNIAAINTTLGGAGTTTARIATARTLTDNGAQDLVQALTDQLAALHAVGATHIEDEIANIKLLAGDGYIIAPATALPTDLYGIVESQVQYLKAKVGALVLVGGNIVIPNGAAIQATAAAVGTRDVTTILTALLP